LNSLKPKGFKLCLKIWVKKLLAGKNLIKLSYVPIGGNPSLHWNKYLELWVMVYHGWNGNIYITTSRNSLNQQSNLGKYNHYQRAKNVPFIHFNF